MSQICIKFFTFLISLFYCNLAELFIFLFCNIRYVFYLMSNEGIYYYYYYCKIPKKGLINLKNDDNECYRWCHITHVNPQTKNPQRIKKSDKQYINSLNYSSTEFPVTVKQINKIENQNSININVFGYEKMQLYPIHISKEKFDGEMNLLLITEQKTTYHNGNATDEDKKMGNIEESWCKDAYSYRKQLMKHNSCIIRRNTRKRNTPVCIVYNNFQVWKC